jgi:1-aminocyclopropane-1-carboxylate deaminase/D-cysteine desulfhydrase-like pyridoxal-dependent ACC family enzyme
VTPNDVRRALVSFPILPLIEAPTSVAELSRLRSELKAGPRLLIKRDDVIPFAFGGNKVRKAALVVARAREDGADTLITAGGIQSNHIRVTAATAAILGMRAVLVVNGPAPVRDSGNLLVDRLMGGEVIFVGSRDERVPKMNEIALALAREGRRAFVVPVGASIPLGALAFVLAVAELADQIPAPDVIVHATSSGGTQAGLVAGCRLLGWPTRVVGISADEPAHAAQSTIERLLEGVAGLIGLPAGAWPGDTAIEVDDRFVGEGYGIPTSAASEAIRLVARTEAILLDPTYTGKAMAGLFSYLRDGSMTANQTVLFWHTGGQVALFA